MLTSREAADRLGIKLDTLYAYVSRGRLRSVAVPGSRERQYRVEDIDALRTARGGLEAPPETDANTLGPAIASSICLIEDGRLYYRGQDAVRLSDSATLEDIAALLWEQREAVPCGPTTPPARRLRGGGIEGSEAGERRPDLIARCQIRLAAVAAEDQAAGDLTRAGIVRTGRVILAELAALARAGRPDAAPIHRRLARAWQLDQTGADLIRRCLVLLADHELNASTFAARVVASTGATPYAAVSAALGAMSGPRHGGVTAEAEALFHQGKESGDPLGAMAERLGRGEAIPGIGHPLYPNGDPRAVAILYALSLVAPQARRFVGRRPNVDFALAAAMTALGLPRGAALSIFVVARAVGWIAHAIEQYESGALIRPRARYTGPRPQTGA